MAYGNKRPRKPIYDPESGVPPTEKQIEKMKKQAVNVSNYWLEQRPHSTEELRQKLVKKGILPDIIEERLAVLTKHELLNDEMFLQLWVMSYSDSIGPKKLERDLLQKGLDPDAIKTALEEIDPEVQADAARDIAERRAKSSVKEQDIWKRKRSITQTLVRKGFDMSDAMRYAEEAVEMFPSEEPPPVLNDDGEEETFEEKQEREKEAALKLAIQKLPGTRSKPLQKRVQSMVSSLMRKGYSYDIAKDAVRDAIIYEQED